jgi:hypothetical protein
VFRLLTFVIVTAVIVLTRARAGACPPAVALTGDEALIMPIRELLDARGITDATPPCPAVRARVERRGSLLVVGTDGPGGAPIVRSVTAAATAATVIESWARTDAFAPLLATRVVPAIEDAGEPVPVVASPPAARGIQLFAALETSVASDHTVWQGMQLEACIMLGPVCAAARLHAAKVVKRSSQPASWDGFARESVEAYIGVDVPIALGSTRLTPGFAAGYGAMFTHRKSDAEHVGIETSGPRAEVHAALSIPLTAHLALDLVATAALTEAARMETRGGDVLDPTIVFPDEPRALVRLAFGVRYGAL